ncbi:nucleotide sugar dehydrogenase [Yinghuangia soli]|uniref:Nucleotide sugar dehydrogenase n=1 Tax=Yinghuangia soli TaxID=2908204 RepID=A0AA41Q0J3_9ACTN|nr:nucleotide sugar dehydrogenase [Yinghuangia soli]MCF2529263.1 nucleotide sugar dehydrogenase [Yinghuangia soli]
MRVVVAGQGYVGLPLAVRAAQVGHDVIGYDTDESRVKRLIAGESYIEDIPAQDLSAVTAAGRYRATCEPGDLAGFDVAVITVPTPLREGAPDLSYVEACARTLGGFLRPGAIVVLESTTFPGTTEELVGPVLAEVSGLAAGRDFRLGFSPERIDPGNPVWNLVNTPKVVSGVDAASLAAVDAFYSSLVERTVPVSTPKEAELAKLLENTFRHVNIALVNEVAMFAHDLGIDVWEAIDACATKPFGFMRFTPGPGVGGHCLPIDPSYLSWRVQRALGQSFRFVELANDVNNHMPDYVVRRLTTALNERHQCVKGAKLLLVGLAYKKNTGDARESPSARIAHMLLDLGAEVAAVDPHVDAAHRFDARLRRVDMTADIVAAADAVVLLVDHDDTELDMIREHASYILDCRRTLGRAEHIEVL